MAAVKRKKGFAIKFDLSLAGAFGVGIVCFCIFFWMFLLGVWSGQTVLSSGKHLVVGTKKNQVKTVETVAKRPAPSASKIVVTSDAKAVPTPAVKKKGIADAPSKVVSKKTKSGPEPEEDPAFFAVQVAAFRDSGLALKEIESWRKKGFKPFSRPPESNDDEFTRVYIGNFDSMAVAKNKAEVLAKIGGIKPFIVLIPAE